MSLQREKSEIKMWISLVFWKEKFLAAAIKSSWSLMSTGATNIMTIEEYIIFNEDENSENESTRGHDGISVQCDEEVLPHNEA